MVVFMTAKEVSSILRQWEMPQHPSTRPKALCVAKPGQFPNHKPTCGVSSGEQPLLQMLLSCPEGVFQAGNSSLTSLWTSLLQVTEFNLFRSSKGSQRHPERQFCLIHLFL